MADRPAWQRRIETSILADLAEERMDYPPLVASRCGVHPDTVSRLCDELAARGLLERVSEESVYRITDRGETVLDERSAAGPGSGSHARSFRED